MKSEFRPVFYAVPGGAWADWVTLLHPPYTVWHLSYVVLGAAAAPQVHLERVAGLALAFFLAVGLSAHALDELRGRPLRTRLPDGWLLGTAVVSLVGALVVGAAASMTISPWAIPFVLFGGIMVPAYNLEWARGRLHTDAWFALAWGAFPALAGYWANAERLDVQALLVASGCFALSLAQRALSKSVKRLRRDAVGVSGKIEYRDGTVEVLSMSRLLAAPEAALRLMAASVSFLALGLLAARL